MSDYFDKPSTKTDAMRSTKAEANDDGFVPGQPVSWEQYSKHRAMARKESINREKVRKPQKQRRGGVSGAIPKATP